jgi:predicted nucleic acid-binding protein
MPVVVLDTRVLVAALLRGRGSARRVLRACLRQAYRPVLGRALLAEYEELLAHSELFAASVLNAKERNELFDGLGPRPKPGRLFGQAGPQSVKRIWLFP